jgi:hypothetical protein
VRSAAAFDQPAVRSDLVGAVDRDVELIQGAERLHLQAEFPGRLLGPHRGRDAAQRQAATRQGRQEIGHGRPRPETNGHAVLDEVSGGLRG